MIFIGGFLPARGRGHPAHPVHTCVLAQVSLAPRPSGSSTLRSSTSTIIIHIHQLWSTENLLHVKPSHPKRRTFDQLTPNISTHPVTYEPRRPMPLERQGVQSLLKCYIWLCPYREQPFHVVSSKFLQQNHSTRFNCNSDIRFFLGPGGPLVEPSMSSCQPSATIFLLLLLLLLLLSSPPSSPFPYPSSPPSVPSPLVTHGHVTLVTPPLTPVVVVVVDGRAFCKWSSGWTSLLQMIIRRDQPLANDHLDQPSSFPCFFFILQQIYYFPPTNPIFSFKTFRVLSQILGSRFNLADLSRTMCSCSSIHLRI